MFLKLLHEIEKKILRNNSQVFLLQNVTNLQTYFYDKQASFSRNRLTFSQHAVSRLKDKEKSNSILLFHEV